jgi:hypothetical protein
MKNGMLGRQAEAACQRSAGRASTLWDPGEESWPKPHGRLALQLPTPARPSLALAAALT